MEWIWIIAALLVGIVAGGLGAYLAMRRRYGDREAVAELRAELDQYKAQVTEHFVETADLVNTLTRTYKNVYDHLETGAYRLVGEEKLRKQLDTVDEEPVMIEYIGQRRSQPEEATSEPRAATRPGRERERERPISTPIGNENDDDETPPSVDGGAGSKGPKPV